MDEDLVGGLCVGIIHSDDSNLPRLVGGSLKERHSERGYFGGGRKGAGSAGSGRQGPGDTGNWKLGAPVQLWSRKCLEVRGSKINV